MFDPTYAPLKDAPKNPTLNIDGNVIHLTRRDPYGHIYISLEHGELPEKYRGAYTSMPIAETEVAKFIEERRVAALELAKEGKVKQKK